ncbi:MAG TPA: thioredoxin family protein [Spirochaetota bacterium]|nr:thioredoxin family protein [Spirochaetota bacterium]HPI91052.1 thioredoxin family protein [Spirochaetota bacterium]HPR49088.1 thioredoxin family protein [Spirochaetota bacterium]
MPLLDDKVKGQLSGILKNMKDTVTLVYGTQEIECNTCRDTRMFIEEIAALSDRIGVEVYDFVKDKEKMASLKIDKIPAIALLDKTGADTGIRFYGLPGGYEINSFLQSLLETSGQKEPLPDALAKRVAAVNKDVHIQVFVSLTCPYCPAAVSTAHRLALESTNIRADMVESTTFIHLAQKYRVQGVPRIVINESHVLEGAHPMPAFLDIIEKL